MKVSEEKPPVKPFLSKKEDPREGGRRDADRGGRETRSTIKKNTHLNREVGYTAKSELRKSLKKDAEGGKKQEEACLS